MSQGAAAEKVPLVAEQEQRSSADPSRRAPSRLRRRTSPTSVPGDERGKGREGEGEDPPHASAARNPSRFTSVPRIAPLPPASRAHRKSGLMSASVLYPWPCGRISLVCGLLLLASSPLLAAGKLGNCTHPLVPEHGGFRCDPSPCRGFPQKSTIHFFCEPGYHINKARVSRCRHGRWQPPIPACVPVKEGLNVNPGDRSNDSMPSMATTAVGVSIFLLTTTACLVVKSRLYPCQSHSRRSSDQLDLMVDGLPVSLPSYEEAVYGSWGQRLPACSAPGPTQLLLAQEAPGRHQSPLDSQADGSHRPLLSTQSPDNPPPPYEEVQSSRPRDRAGDGEVRQLRVALSDDKDT